MKYLSLIFLAVLFSLPATAQVSVMSYNIRYATESDGENAWSQRKGYLAAQVAFYEPDILGVQEALLEQLEFLDEELQQYTGSGKVGMEEKKGSSVPFSITPKNLRFWIPIPSGSRKLPKLYPKAGMPPSTGSVPMGFSGKRKPESSFTFSTPTSTIWGSWHGLKVPKLLLIK